MFDGGSRSRGALSASPSIDAGGGMPADVMTMQQNESKIVRSLQSQLDKAKAELKHAGKSSGSGDRQGGSDAAPAPKKRSRGARQGGGGGRDVSLKGKRQ